MAKMNMIAALNSALDLQLQRDPNVVIFGEDVGYFGGVFRVTAGLQEAHGAHRVFDSPLAEGGIAAVAFGMGINGLRPVMENPVRGLHLPRLRSDRQRDGQNSAIAQVGNSGRP